MSSESTNLRKEIIIRVNGELRQWVTLIYLKLSISGIDNSEVRALSKATIDEMSDLSIFEFRDVFHGMFDSINSNAERLNAVAESLDTVLPLNGQAALGFELNALANKRESVKSANLVKPIVEKTAKKLRDVQEAPPVYSGPDLGRLPVHVEDYFRFTETAREKEAAIVDHSQRRIAEMLLINERISRFDLSRQYEVSDEFMATYPQYAGVVFLILAIDNAAYVDTDLELLKRYNLRGLILVQRVDGQTPYRLKAECLVEIS